MAPAPGTTAPISHHDRPARARACAYDRTRTASPADGYTPPRPLAGTRRNRPRRDVHRELWFSRPAAAADVSGAGGICVLPFPACPARPGKSSQQPESRADMAGQMAVLGEAVVRLGWGVVGSFGGLPSALASLCRRCRRGLALQGGPSFPCSVCSAVSISGLLCAAERWSSWSGRRAAKMMRGADLLEAKAEVAGAVQLRNTWEDLQPKTSQGFLTSLFEALL